MRTQGIKSAGPGAPRSVPAPGSVSAVGPAGAAPKPRIKNTRNYGKTAPNPVSSPAPPVFGDTGDSSGRLGGI